MDELTDHLISGPPFTCTFSSVDQVTPPIYSRRVLIFSRRDDETTEATRALKLGLERTIGEIPVLAGQMGYEDGLWTIKKGCARLRIRKIDMDFGELEKSAFSESMLPADLISSVPTLADPQTEWHACRLQANFIDGGLLLVVSINHTVRSHPYHAAHNGIERASLDKLGNSAGDVSKLDAYSVVSGTPNLGPISSNIVTTTFRLGPDALKRLKLAASPIDGWISTHDAVNALCFRTHARGRHQKGLITDDDVGRFAFPVDFRKVAFFGIPDAYIGNAVLMTKVDLPVKTLLGVEGLSQAARAIREGINRINSEYVENFVAVAKSLEKPGQMKINLKLQDRNTAFGSTSYKSFDHAELGWPLSLGKFERMRLCSGVTGEGMSIILPVLGDGSWEVTVSFEEELEEIFRNDEELISYTS